MLLCKFCQKECKSRNSLRNHERLCKENPDRDIGYIIGAQEKRTQSLRTRKERGTFRNQWSDPEYVLKKETRQKLIESSKRQTWNEDRRYKHSEAMKLAVENNPESYTSSNRGRTKQIIFDGIKFQGKWELEFYQYCKDNDIQIERPNEWFEYEWHGTRKYFPDFYLAGKNLYVEVKGYETERDKAKWSSFPKQLKIIRKDDIIAIRKGLYKGL